LSSRHRRGLDGNGLDQYPLAIFVTLAFRDAGCRSVHESLSDHRNAEYRGRTGANQIFQTHDIALMDARRILQHGYRPLLNSQT
ncbi:hypothetical protein, partial [Bradyrhizobium sp.]|uniref:hypothetical protein n=1 Tax=Bradyrhizobium sp. TaxID=376 RepID=UPI001EC046BA